MTGNYIFVYLVTDETTLLPRSVAWVEEDSVNKYARQCEQALLERWTDVEVDVTTYSQKMHVETDVPDADEEVIRAIVEAVWSRFDWLVTDPADRRSGFLVVWTGSDGAREQICEEYGYATLADAERTAREFFAPENAENVAEAGRLVGEIPVAAEIWLGGEVVAIYTP